VSQIPSQYPNIAIILLLVVLSGFNFADKQNALEKLQELKKNLENNTHTFEFYPKSLPPICGFLNLPTPGAFESTQQYWCHDA
jgi:hypothetical protein